MLKAKANDLESELERLVKRAVPMLRRADQRRAAVLLVVAPRTPPNDGAFAMLGGSARIPASSGQNVRYRLNRGSDHQLNRALHTIVLTRLKHDPATRAYAARRAAEGKTPREIKLPQALRRAAPVPRPRSHLTLPTHRPPPRARTLGTCS